MATVQRSAPTSRFALFDTALGSCALVWSVRGISRVYLPEKNRAALLDKLQQLGGVPHGQSPPPLIAQVISKLIAQCGGEQVEWHNVMLDEHGVSAFRMRVYRALLQVPLGETVSYGELAALVGSPGAARAVGSAMANNPWPLLVPCHRVLAAGGKLGGFTSHGGLDTKRRLLDIEGALPRAEASRQISFAPSLLDAAGR